MTATIALPLVVLLPLLVGTALAPVAARISRAAAAWAAAVVTLGALAIVSTQAGAVFAGAAPRASWPWVPDIGLELALRLDGLALLFAILILAIGLLVILYAHYYLSEKDPAGKLFGLLMLFMAAMLGIALADNLLLLIVFWELTSVSSFLLVGYWGDRAEARQGARMALAVTGAGGLAMLAGFLILGALAGTYEISTLAVGRERVQADPLFPVALGLILAGAFTKSAQFPFHFWLPEAMAAPTPVSAYLHSATMVKAGVFLLLRLHPVLGGNAVFEYVVCTVGLVTMVFGAYVAIFKHDLKGLLAYSTISHLGLIVFLIGLDSPLSSVAAVFHTVNHATFKASLFMAAGIIDHECGTRDMRRINGLWKYMPYTATLAIVASAAMAGVPLLNGFLSKEMFFAEALDLRGLGLLGTIAPLAATLGGAFGVAYSARFIHDVFWNGEPRGLPKTPHEPPRFMKVPVEIFVVVCVAVGVAPALTVAPIVGLAARDVVGAPLPDYSIAIWHGLTWPLAMSAIASAGGIALYWALQRKYRLHLHVPSGWTARLAFTHAVDALFALARRVTRAIDADSLQRQVALLVAVTVIVTAAALLGSGLSLGPRALLAVPLLGAVAWLVLIAASLACVLLHRDRLVAVVLAGAVGLVVATAFLYLSAPDLALTQLSVEVVTTVLLLMALALLPRRSPRESSSGRRLRDAVLAGSAGLGVAVMAFAALTRNLESISWYFMETAVPKGGGANAVNVILVDFRGFDTYGEINVLAVAALGVAALMTGMRARRPDSDPDGRTWSPQKFPLLFAVAARWMLPFALLVSVYVFLRGHNAPGGGFVAGLVTAIALVMHYMANGFARTQARLGLDFARVAALGLAIAGATGLGALYFGKPFLSSAYGHPVVGLLGEVPLATAALFDFGVYLVVVGATLLTLVSLGSASQRPPEST
ncbi:MAG TPA: monovalent cation/H+ antiporter subunit A [Burkholderiales bacterium]|nr:monovalent cation/H+ antiporter subunit A [Burkholderiales bacterium]